MDKRQFLKTCAVATALLPVAHSANALVAPTTRRLPMPLNKGDTVGLVAPSKATDKASDIQIAQESLEALGVKVKIGKSVRAHTSHFGGSDAERAADINEMFADKAVKAIICLSGGMGALRVLPLLNYSLIRANPKIFLGFSDITALLNGINAQTDLVTFHGPNGTSSWNSFTVEQFQQLFLSRELVQYKNVLSTGDDLVPQQNRISTINGGKVRGEIMGGNMTLLTALAGSPYLPDFRGKILLLEDTDEPSHRIDRMFSTLKLMGALDKIAGFIFGSCNDCRPSSGYSSLTLDEIFNDYIKPLKIPAYSGAMVGHIRQQFIVPIGAKIEMDADAGSFKLVEPIFQGQ